MPRPKEQNPYDTIFEFLFAQSKQKGGKKGKPLPPFAGTSEIGQAFADFATTPTMWVFNQAINAPFGDIGSVAKIKFRPLASGDRTFYKYKRGTGNVFGGDIDVEYSTEGVKLDIDSNKASSFIANPKKFIDKAFENYREEQRWAMYGAWTRSMDAVLLAGMAWQAGLRGDEGKGIMSALLGSDPSKSTLSSDLRAQRIAFDQKIKAVSIRTGADVSVLRRAVNLSMKEADKTHRYDIMRGVLVTDPGLAAHADNIAAQFWGDPGDAEDQGLWSTSNAKENAREALIERLSLQAEDAMNAAQISNDPEDLERAARIARLIDTIDLFEDQNGKTPGAVIGRIIFFRRWLGDQLSGSFAQNAFNGNLFTPFGDNAMYGVTRQRTAHVYDRDGNDTGATEKIVLPTESPIGAAFGWLYYAHPMNAVRGIFWDGRIWLRIAKWRADRMGLDGINGDSFAYKMYKLMPGNALGKWMGARTAASNRWINERLVRAFRIPLPAGFDLSKITPAGLIKTVVTQWLSKALSFSLPGVGFAVSFVIDRATEALMPFLKGAVSLFALILFGVMAVILMLVGGLFPRMGSLTYAQPNLNPPITARGSSGEVPPGTENPVWSVADLPEGYDGTCLVLGNPVCTQGSTGAVSTRHQNFRAIDFGLNAGTPIAAPHKARITESHATSQCGDGSNYGGTIRFTEINEDGSDGLSWTFFHIHPAVSVGQIVDQGETIGTVDGYATADYSDVCWTGPHAHIEVQDPSGLYMDAGAVMRAMGCSYHGC